MFWSMHSGIIAAIAVVFARYLSYYVRIGDTGMRAVAIGAIAILTAINCLGVKPGSRLQTLFAAGKVLAIVMIIGVVMLLGARVPRGTTVAPEVAFSARELTLAVVAGLFAFGGWHMVTYTAEETRSPTRTIPLALTIGTATVTICYLALNAAYLYVLPVERVVSSTRIAADAAEALVGNRGGAVIAGLVMFSSLGALNGIILTGPRVYLAMARDGLLFRSMGAIHPRFRTPYIALIVQALWSSVLVMTGTYRSLFTRVIYTEWIFFALMALGLFRLRGRPDYAPAYRAWGYPVVPLLFALSSGTIVATQIASDLAESAAGLLLVAVGLPVYYLWESDRAKRGRQLRPGDLA
jgi:APA family basic amino acid/polyamine antiporter